MGKRTCALCGNEFTVDGKYPVGTEGKKPVCPPCFEKKKVDGDVCPFCHRVLTGVKVVDGKGKMCLNCAEVRGILKAR